MTGASQGIHEVPAKELASLETPLAIGPDVGVPVLQDANMPFAEIGVLEFVAAVHDAVCVIRIVEVDDVGANEVDRRPYPAQRLDKPCTKSIASAFVASDMRILHEQGHQLIHIARV